MQENEKRAVQTRDKHRHIFNSTTEKYKGQILQYYGDGTLSIFNSAIDAVTCAIEMQLNFLKKPSIPVRIGIHTGDIIISEEEIIGDSVNVAARIESLAAPGSIFISDKVYDEIKNQESVKTSLLKTFKLKNVEKPIQVYAISNTGLIVPKPEDIKGKTDTDSGSLPEKQEQPGPKIQEESSITIILATKLYIPPPRPKIVHRPRLIEQLNRGLHGKLTLISAPAGFGKTTLISEWISGFDRPVAWLSMDEGDNDPTRFLVYLIAALQTIEANIGEGVLVALQSPQTPPVESILTTLLNEISLVQENFTLVLDDYHVVDAKPVHEALNFLLEHLPPQMHLAITTREDPDLPLPRLRVRDQLTELRAADLRFTTTEAAGFLKQVMGLNLSTGDIDALGNLTEGWVAGLQLAALSMQGREDISGFIRAFAGHDRYVLDYLGEEVLKRQKEHVRGFLLQTSILARLSGPLCDAVTARDDGKRILETLERGNLFVVSLDDKRQWYRYHHLFSDVLHTHLLDEQPDQVPVLHRRASTWYEQNGLPAEAVHHAFAAEDLERVAGLLELEWPVMNKNSQAATWLGWVKVLPDDLVRKRPVLSTAYAWALLQAGELEAGEVRLKDAEQALKAMTEGSDRVGVSSGEMVVVDEVQFRSLSGMIANARAYLAQALGDVPKTLKYAQRALDLLPEGSYIERGIPTVLLGFGQLAKGDLKAAYKSMTDVMASFRKAGDISAAISPTFVLVEIRMAQGRLHEAVSRYEESLQLVMEQGKPVPRGTAELYFGLSGLFSEQGDIESARQLLLNGEELGEQARFPDQSPLYLAKALLKKAQGDLSGALKLLDKAENLYVRSPIPNLRPVAALKTEVWVRQGKLTQALGWVRSCGLSYNDDLSYLREFEHITLARVLIAAYKSEGTDRSIHEAMGLLERLLKGAEEGGRTGSVIKILILLAVAHQAEGNITLALAPLEHALALAEPQNYVQIFLDEGLPMDQLLLEAADRGIKPDYINKLRALFKADT